jgi:nucleotide-binding universal stress UspA family protein
MEGANAMQRILVAYDGGEPGRRALDTAIEMAKGVGALMSVVSVVPAQPGLAPVAPWEDRGVHAEALREARLTLEDAGIDAEYLELAGDPARTIERLVDELGYDVVVVGSRGLGAVDRFLLGSVSSHLATHANATVIVAR